MNVEIVTASAGTGKTEYLCRTILAALDAGVARVEGVVAVTYTRKAEAELRGRIRRALVKNGSYDEAQRLPLAYIGTVHAVCLRLLKENAIDVGLSPDVDVLREEGAEPELARALELALHPDEQRRFEEVCSRVRPNWNTRDRRYNWTVDAADLIELARSNRIHADELGAMARRSTSGLLTLLPNAVADGDPLDRNLSAAIDEAHDALVRSGDDRKNTQTTIEALHEVRRAASSGPLPWMEWVRLTKLAPAKAHDSVIDRVRAIAGEHLRHPRFHADLAGYVNGIYDIAAKSLGAYRAWKDERRLIDYVDMEERALTLLERADLAERLRGELDLLIVDEFQDTSPIQLELFVRLADLATKTIWVGDRKQSIFAFRGADPVLMDAVVRAVEDSGRSPFVLDTSYRSREALVRVVSDLFVPSFGRHGYASEHVRVRAARSDGGFGNLPPLQCWALESTNQVGDADAVARGVARLLAQPANTPVEERLSRSVRPLVASDIAILAATNVQVDTLANALDRAGVPNVVRRAGLLCTPEGSFLAAALRCFADRDDHSAIAEIDALTGFDGLAPDDWLSARIAAFSNERGRFEPKGIAERLVSRRDHLGLLSPVDAVDAIIAETDLFQLCRRWDRPDQRVANLDAFRALARDYVAECAYEREAASLTGFLVFLRRRQEVNEDRQHSVADAGVHVCTYHRAKGLEWPVVILTGLDSKSRAYGVPPDAAPARLQRGVHHRVFSAAAESDSPRFDPRQPLAGRWLRMWPWPYGTHQATELAATAASTSEAKLASDSETRESLRLLYVGFTRPRDHLVIAARADKDGSLKAGWLDALSDGPAIRAVTIGVGDRDLRRITLESGNTHAVAVWRVPIADGPSVRADLAARRLVFATPAIGTSEHRPYRIAPARARTEWPELDPARVTAQHLLGRRSTLNIGDHDPADVGAAIHAFLAAERFDLPFDRRTELAAALLHAHGMASVLRAGDLVAASESLRAFVNERWPTAVWHREFPVAASIDTAQGRCRVDGRIDLLLETADGWVVIDHKSYPGPEATWANVALEHAPQLAAYRAVLSMAGGTIAGCFIHFTIGGGIVELGFV